VGHSYFKGRVLPPRGFALLNGNPEIAASLEATNENSIGWQINDSMLWRVVSCE
jgi:hypothetical protein